MQNPAQDPNGSLRASADTERRIDSEVVSVLKDAYSRVTALLVRPFKYCTQRIGNFVVCSARRLAAESVDHARSHSASNKFCFLLSITSVFTIFDT